MTNLATARTPSKVIGINHEISTLDHSTNQHTTQEKLLVGETSSLIVRFTKIKIHIL